MAWRGRQYHLVRQMGFKHLFTPYVSKLVEAENNITPSDYTDEDRSKSSSIVELQSVLLYNQYIKFPVMTHLGTFFFTEHEKYYGTSRTQKLISYL